MSARTQRTKDVAAIELARGQEIQRSGEEPDPGGAAYGMEKEIDGVYAGMKDGRKEMQEQWNAEDDVGMGGVRESGNNLGVENSVNQCGNGENEADQRARRADIEQGASGTDRRANKDKRAKGADESGSGNKEGVAGADMVMAAGEEMAKFMRQENRHER